MSACHVQWHLRNSIESLRMNLDGDYIIRFSYIYIYIIFSCLLEVSPDWSLKKQVYPGTLKMDTLKRVILPFMSRDTHGSDSRTVTHGPCGTMVLASLPSIVITRLITILTPTTQIFCMSIDAL